jgi:hypothetical protein
MNWLKHLFSRRKLYDELAEEMREHLEEKIEELVESGMSREEAAYAARREFGSVMLIEEDGREVWRWAALEDFLMDVKFGLRMLRKNPGFTAVAVLTLALGIAANTTIFSAVNGWMLRRPRIKDPGRVVVILTTDPTKGGWGWDRQPVSAFDFLSWREQSESFEDMAASERGDFALTAEGEPERLTGMRVSANYFEVLGVSAAMGRTFLPHEDRSAHNRVVILSHRLWQRRFAYWRAYSASYGGESDAPERGVVANYQRPPASPEPRHHGPVRKGRCRDVIGNCSALARGGAAMLMQAIDSYLRVASSVVREMSIGENYERNVTPIRSNISRLSRGISNSQDKP